MLKKIFLFIVLLFIFSCAPFIKTTQLNSLKPGITKADFIKTYGEPTGTNYYNGYYFLSYFVGKDVMDDYKEYYFAFDKNDRLVGWKAQNENTIRTSGMVLTFPIPSGQ